MTLLNYEKPSCTAPNAISGPLTRVSEAHHELSLAALLKAYIALEALQVFAPFESSLPESRIIHLSADGPIILSGLLSYNGFGAAM